MRILTDKEIQEGWILHEAREGTVCPIPKDILVEVKLVDGSVPKEYTAGGFRWDNIVAYRITRIPSPAPKEDNEWHILAEYREDTFTPPIDGGVQVLLRNGELRTGRVVDFRWDTTDRSTDLKEIHVREYDIMAYRKPCTGTEEVPISKEEPSTSTLLKERESIYGSFQDVASLSQEFKEVMRGSKNFEFMATTGNGDMVEALEMISSKIARILNGNISYVDSWKDISGYATLIVNRLEKNK